MIKIFKIGDFMNFCREIRAIARTQCKLVDTANFFFNVFFFSECLLLEKTVLLNVPQLLLKLICGKIHFGSIAFEIRYTSNYEKYRCPHTKVPPRPGGAAGGRGLRRGAPARRRRAPRGPRRARAPRPGDERPPERY